MLELDGTIWLRAGEDNWGGRGRIELLAAIGQTGSITAGAKAVGLSYKAAWDAIDTMNNLAGEPLVVRTTGGKGGGGSVLTPRAQRLIESFRVLEAEHRRFVERLDAAAQAASEDVHLLRRLMLRTSARNTLFGTVESVAPGAVNMPKESASHHVAMAPPAKANRRRSMMYLNFILLRQAVCADCAIGKSLMLVL
jgi:molybdate transport system regulatory protein